MFVYTWISKCLLVVMPQEQANKCLAVRSLCSFEYDWLTDWLIYEEEDLQKSFVSSGGRYEVVIIIKEEGLNRKYIKYTEHTRKTIERFPTPTGRVSDGLTQN